MTQRLHNVTFLRGIENVNEASNKRDLKKTIKKGQKIPTHVIIVEVCVPISPDVVQQLDPLFIICHADQMLKTKTKARIKAPSFACLST